MPHGCDGSPTIAGRVAMPEGLTSVKAQEVAGWDIEIVREELDEPAEGGHGEVITDRVAEVVWRGGPLPDEHLQEFGLSFRLPDGSEGEVLHFPTIQECEARWVEIPDAVEQWGELDTPAPHVQVAGFAGHDDDGAEEADATVARGDAEAQELAAATLPEEAARAP